MAIQQNWQPNKITSPAAIQRQQPVTTALINMRAYAFAEDFKRINDINLACLAVRMGRDCRH